MEIMTPNQIKKLRKKHSLTAQQLADIAGVSVRTVRAWEIGYRNPSRSAVQLIKTILSGGNI